MSQRLTLVTGLHLILHRGNSVLLARRFNTGFADGLYNFPCGHLDADEELTAALMRETAEEIGIKIKKKDLTLIGVTHWMSRKQSINLFFESKKWTGTPRNMEPDKCDDLAWFPLNKLPRRLTPQTKAALKAYVKKEIPFLIEKLK